MHRHIYLLDKCRNHLIQLLIEDLDFRLVDDIIQYRVLLEEILYHVIRHLLDQLAKVSRYMDFSDVAYHIGKAVLIDI